MRNRWCTIALVLGFFGLSFLFSLIREQVFGQQVPIESGRQVVVQPPPALPKGHVDFTSIIDPANPSKQIRVITVVDLEARRILVYHGDLAAGTVKWCSTRNIHPDIVIDDFNTIKPTPREIEDEIRRLNKNH